MTKEMPSHQIQINDFGQMWYFLGMEVVGLKKRVNVSQQKYILDLLTKIGMLGCKPSDTPMKREKKNLKMSEIQWK